MNTLQLLFAQPWVDRLAWTLIHFLWQGALLAVVFVIARRFAHKPEVRYALACAVFAAMAAAPFVTFWVVGSASIAPPVAITAVPDPSPAAAFQTDLSKPDLWRRVFPWLVASWFAGVMVFSIRLIGGWFVATRLRFKSAAAAPPEWQQILERLAARIGATRPVRLLVSTATDVPAVVGWLRPAILVPAAALAGFPAGYVEALLTHELAHIRRHDFLLNVLQKIVEALLFYHPAVWWISKQIRIERELCCDDLAVAASGDVITYARALTELESLRPAHASLAVSANGGSLVHRIRRLLAPSEPDAHALPGLGAASITSLLILLGIVAAARAQEQPKPIVGPAISRDAIWIDTVKQGDMQIDVRALGTLTSRTSVRIMVPESRAGFVRLGQQGFVEFHGPQRWPGAVVSRIDRRIVNGTVAVDLQVPQLPDSRPVGEQIDATIQIETLRNVLYLGRPIFSAENAEEMLFKLDPDGRQAIRVKVHYGRSSVNTIQILSGLAPGDRMILSDTSKFGQYDRILVQ